MTKRGVTACKKLGTLREAQIITARRKALGFTQQQVAVEAGLQIRQYQRFEYGERLVSKASMKQGLRICAALELDPFELVFEDGEDIAGKKT